MTPESLWNQLTFRAKNWHSYCQLGFSSASAQLQLKNWNDLAQLDLVWNLFSSSWLSSKNFSSNSSLVNMSTICCHNLAKLRNKHHSDWKCLFVSIFDYVQNKTLIFNNSFLPDISSSLIQLLRSLLANVNCFQSNWSNSWSIESKIP